MNKKRDKQLGESTSLGTVVTNGILNFIWGSLKAVVKVFDVFLIGLSWLPIQPLRQVGLDTAVRCGWLNSVKRLATPQFFQSMPLDLNCSIMLDAGVRATRNDSSDNHIEIFTTLLSNGGVLSDNSFQSGFFFSDFTLFTLNSLVRRTPWLTMAIKHNAVHDDIKCTLLLKSMADKTCQYEKIPEQILSAWSAFFKNIQHDKIAHDGLWANVIDKGSDTLVQKLIECTPQHLLTPQRLSPLFAQRTTVSQRTDISTSTFGALEARGFDLEDLLTTILRDQYYWPTNPPPNKNPVFPEQSFKRNPALKEAIEHAQNIKQKKRMLEAMDGNTYARENCATKPQVATRRKM